MVILVKKKDNQSSSKIIQNEISNLHKAPLKFVKRLKVIKDINKQIYSLIVSKNAINSFKDIGSLINRSWQVQKKLSRKISIKKGKDLEQELLPFIFGLRGPGCGANSFFLLLNPKFKKQAFGIIESAKKDYLVYYAKVNKTGLVVET